MNTGCYGESDHQYIKADNGCQYHAVVMNEFGFHKKAFNYTDAISVPFRWPIGINDNFIKVAHPL
jgi:hypothetical protein